MGKLFHTALSISILLASSSACNAPALSPDTVYKSQPLSELAQSDSGIINTSSQLRNAVGFLNHGKDDEAMAELTKISLNANSSKSDRELASFLIANKKSTENTKALKVESLAYYQVAFNHSVLGLYSRLKASELAKELDDETKIQSILAPCLNLTGKSATDNSVDKNQNDLLAQAIYRLAESFYRSQKYKEAISSLSTLRTAFPKSTYATGSAYYLGKIALDQNDDGAKAIKYFREYIKRSPGGRFSPEIVKSLQSLGGYGTTNSGTPENPNHPAKPVFPLTQADHNIMAYACLRHTLWKMALDEWSLAQNRHILRTVCLAHTNQKQEAIDEFITLAKANPTNPLILNVATELSKPLTSQQALMVWKGLSDLNIKGKDEVFWNIAKRDKGNAESYYKKIVTSYPKSKHADSALWWLIWHHIQASYQLKGKVRQNHLHQAALLCVKGVQDYPNSELAPLYAFWSGKIHERLGQKSEAIKIYNITYTRYPISYYGYRSRQRAIHLQSAIQAAKPGQQKRKVIPDRKWQIHPNRKNPVLTWRWPSPPTFFSWSQISKEIGALPTLLAWMGEYKAALSILPNSAPKYFKGWLMVKDGQILRGLGLVAYKLKGKPEKTPFWYFAYPLAHAAEIDAEARKHGVDPLLAHGLIRQESRYDPNARSRSNAMGLMQLLKGTAYGVAKHNQITLSSTEQIFEPSTNIKLGCAYLGYVLKGKSGNAMLAVASYNGGPNAVKRWLAKHNASGIKDMDYFVENIPYLETRGYVRKVFANYWNYEKLYLNN